MRVLQEGAGTDLELYGRVHQRLHQKDVRGSHQRQAARLVGSVEHEHLRHASQISVKDIAVSHGLE